MFRVDSLEEKVTPTNSSRPAGSLDSSITHKEASGKEFNELQNTMMKLFNELADEFKTTIDVIKEKMDKMNIRIGVTMKVVENVTSGQTHTRPNKLKFPNPRPFKGNWDAKELENFIFDIEQYFKAAGACTEDIKDIVATMHLIDDAKLLWRSKVQDIENEAPSTRGKTSRES